MARGSVTPAQLMTGGFEEFTSKPGLLFSIWFRQRDGRYLAYDGTDVFTFDSEGMAREPLAILLTMELKDIVRVGNSSIPPGNPVFGAVQARLNALISLTLVADPTTFGIV